MPDIKKHKTANIGEDRDISEQKSVEEQLRTASLYARSLIEASLDPLVTISADGKIMDVNKATELVTGVSREQLIGSDFSEYFTEPEKAREGYQEVFTKGFVKDYPLAIRHASGRVIEVLYNASVYKNEGGEVQGVFAAARDVTELKQAEEQLRVASLYARSLIEASIDPFVTISADGKIMDVNEATELVTGVSRDHLIGSDFSEYFTEPQKAREGYQEVFSKGFVKDYPLAIRHSSGRVTEVLYNASVYKNEAGEVQGVFAAARDITELKRAEEQLRKAHQELEVRVQERTAELTKAMELLKEQQKAFMEVSVPVVKVWNRILLVPLIGVFDSQRAELLMEMLLTELENTQAKVAILDVSGIPIVDSLVAKHLIRTVSAVKLMGAECIVTGIRSRISQTIVQLGIDLSGITTRTALAEGLKVALDLTDQKVVSK
ncbi:MAG: PAS domain S-box protein [Candidatus Methanoperedens sp.]|nr:PAS domain S-box protein [Candidatus Methanoperedens sp.]